MVESLPARPLRGRAFSLNLNHAPLQRPIPRRAGHRSSLLLPSTPNDPLLSQVAAWIAYPHGKGCHIGCGATLIQGVRIGQGALVAAGAVVTGDVEPGLRVARVPARVPDPR